MTTHHLGSDRVHHAWDNAIAPLITVDSGDTVVFETRDASDGRVTATSAGGQVTPAAPAPFLGHPLTGPVAIRGAKPGDRLEVEVVSIQPASWGWTRFAPGRGLLPDDFDTGYLHIWDLTKDPAPFAHGIHVPLEPFLGVMGVALAEPGPHSTMPPRQNGGNMDTKQLTAGSRLYLPVLVADALFSCGDGHAAQGDGEVCITAIECPMTTTLRLTLIQDAPLEAPELETVGPITGRTNTAGWYATTGYGPDLMESARDAVRRMIAYLVRNVGISREEAYILSSVAVDLKISEVVDAPNWIVSAFLPKSILPAAGTH